MDKLINQLKHDFPELIFIAGEQFCWSPGPDEIIYPKEKQVTRTAPWSLLHEVGHALLKHKRYNTDFELLQLESKAWQKACEIGQKYGYEIDPHHIQDCLDTYRDWLHQRSSCPTCGNRSFQQNQKEYTCFNCNTIWKVSASRFCRPYRMTKNRAKQKSPSGKTPKTTFV